MSVEIAFIGNIERRDCYCGSRIRAYSLVFWWWLQGFETRIVRTPMESAGGGVLMGYKVIGWKERIRS